MSKQFTDNMNRYEKALYEFDINIMLLDIWENSNYNDTIKNLVKTALINNWSIDKKINVLNSIDDNDMIA